MDLLEKGEDYEYTHEWLGLGLLTSTGEKWRKHRKLLTPTFHFSILKDFIPIFDQNVDILVNKLKIHADNNDIFDVNPLITKCTLDQLLETSMGISINAQENDHTAYADCIKNLTCIINDRMKNLFTRFDIIFHMLPQYKVYKKSLKYIHDFTDNVIKDRRRLLEKKQESRSSCENEKKYFGAKKYNPFLDMLLEAEVDGHKLNDIDIRDEVNTFLFEGHDTTSSALSFTLYELSKNPEVQEKLYEEQLGIFGDKKDAPVTFRDLQEMSYLDMAIRETLRIYPSVPLIARYCRKETIMNDVTIPAGTDVDINIIGLGRDPEIFPDPLAYKPERFCSEEISKRSYYSNVFFSVGPRNCIGQKFAMLEMKTTLSKILRNFKVMSACMEPLKLSGDIVLKSANGVHIQLMNRM